jgi:hypothetical protein
MRLNNPLFNIETLLSELQSGPKGEKTALEILQKKIKDNYFDPAISNKNALEKLNNPGFDKFPRLQYVLKHILEGQSNIEIPHHLQDWIPGGAVQEPEPSFQVFENKYGYFKDHLQHNSKSEMLNTLFQKLVVSCRKMTILIENKTHDDEMAYKLMALFCDPNQNADVNFAEISTQFNKLLGRQDRTIDTPYHDAFITALNNFPKLSEIQDFQSWKNFITKEGFQTLEIFASYANNRAAFQNIKEAKEFLLNQTYPRANESDKSLELAKICRKMLILNAEFEAGLKEIENVWPKKQTDNLPIVDINHTIFDEKGNIQEQYFWVKLPPKDMRALYLGKAIRGCCQYIGGHSEQCVKDGMSLSDNGFYVLLKANKKSSTEPRIVNDEINDAHYAIVAQSYAWKTNNGNLCLDSIEWNQERVTSNIIKDLMTKFSEEIFKEHPYIKYINVGTGGQTPTDTFTYCPINETMKQGYSYGDASQQYQIACNMPKEMLASLIARLDRGADEYHKTILYLAPYFEDIENVPHQLRDVLGELSKKLSKINLPPKLSTLDFKKISFEDYQNMDESDKASISTVCKLFNSQHEEDLKKWLPTIPDNELSYISLIKNNYSLEFKVDVLQKMPPEQQWVTLHELDGFNKNLLMQSLNQPELLKIILDLYPKEQRLAAVSVKDQSGKSTLIYAVLHPESLKIILELIPEDQRLAAVTEKGNDGKSLLIYAVLHPESLKIILELIPEDQRLAAVTVEDEHDKSILMYTARKIMHAAKKTKNLKIILELIPKDQRLAAVKAKDEHDKSILMYIATNPDSLRTILELLPESHRLEAVTDKNIYGFSTLMSATTNPQCLKMILEIYPPDQRLKAVTDKTIYDSSTLMSVATKPNSLKVILETLPKETALIIETCINHFGKSFEKPAFSLLDFMTDMQGLATPDTINDFVHAVMQNQNIDKALAALLTHPSSNSLFETNLKQDIQERICKLDYYWLQRIPKVEIDSPTIEPPSQLL